MLLVKTQLGGYNASMSYLQPDQAQAEVAKYGLVLYDYLKRQTLRSLLVLSTLAQQGRPLYQAEIASHFADDAANLSRSLAKLEADGLLRSFQEEGQPQQLGRPLRRYYEVTPKGRDLARDLAQLVAVKGPLDAEPLNPEYSPYEPLGNQVPAHDHTYTATGPDAEAFCDALWECLEYLRGGGYEVWTRNAVSIRLRTNRFSYVELFVKEIEELTASFRKAGVAEG